MLLYSPIMALARFAMGVHYVSDVLVGHALGLMLAVALGRWFGAAGYMPSRVRLRFRQQRMPQIRS